MVETGDGDYEKVRFTVLLPLRQDPAIWHSAACAPAPF